MRCAACLSVQNRIEIIAAIDFSKIRFYAIIIRQGQVIAPVFSKKSISILGGQNE
jgi:hypothetical protein